MRIDTKRGIAVLLAGGVLLSAPAVAKEKTTKWEGEFCNYSATYDPEIYDPKSIRATYEFVDGGYNVAMPNSPVLQEPEHLAKIDIPKYQAECERALGDIRMLGLVDLPSVNEYRKAKLEAVRDTCQFEVAEMRSFRDPSALRSYQPSEAMCSRHIDALEGKSDIRAVWREIVDRNCKTNGNPKACRKRFEDAAAMPDGAERIRMTVTSFGWRNCTVSYTKENTIDFDGLREKVVADMKRKFKLREYQCSEP